MNQDTIQFHMPARDFLTSHNSWFTPRNLDTTIVLPATPAEERRDERRRGTDVAFNRASEDQIPIDLNDPAQIHRLLVALRNWNPNPVTENP